VHFKILLVRGIEIARFIVERTNVVPNVGPSLESAYHRRESGSLAPVEDKPQISKLSASFTLKHGAILSPGIVLQENTLI
jgi:hypothetical protein